MPFSRYLVGIKPSFLSLPTYFSGLDCEIRNCLRSFSHSSSPIWQWKINWFLIAGEAGSINGVTSNIILLILLVMFFSSPRLLESFKQGGLRLILVNICHSSFSKGEFWQNRTILGSRREDYLVSHNIGNICSTLLLKWLLILRCSPLKGLCLD